MIKKLTLTIVCSGLLWGCAGMQPQRAFKGNTFTSDFPKLKVKIHKSHQWDQGKKSKRYGKLQHDNWWWQVASKEGVGILFTTHHKSKSFDYYYSLEDITRNWGRIPLESLNINEHNWIKYAYVNEKKYLHTGFFTRKGDCLISVYRYVYPAEFMSEVEKLYKASILTDYHRKLLDEAFDSTNKLFTIEY
ncbi:MAG: hypothetical protein PVI71_03990 [Desulfobacterales bacterium]|jgi:hypothetical protein